MAAPAFSPLRLGLSCRPGLQLLQSPGRGERMHRICRVYTGAWWSPQSLNWSLLEGRWDTCCVRGDTKSNVSSLSPPPPSRGRPLSHQRPVGSPKLWLVAEFALLLHETTRLPWLPAQPQAAGLAWDQVRVNVQGLQLGRLQFHCKEWGCQTFPRGLVGRALP